MTEPFNYAGNDLEAMAAAPNYYRWLLQHIRPLLGQRIIEVGAGCGNFSRYLLSTHPEQLISIEPSEGMFPKLESAASACDHWQARNGYLSDLLPQLYEPVDSLVYINVMEHIEDDAGEMRLAANCLRPGGALIVYVPALPFLYSDFDRSIGHYRRYRKPALRDLALQAGFQIQRLFYCDCIGIPLWFVRMKLLRGRLKASEVAVYDRWIFPPLAWLETRLQPPIGKNLLLIGRKRPSAMQQAIHD